MCEILSGKVNFKGFFVVKLGSTYNSAYTLLKTPVVAKKLLSYFIKIHVISSCVVM